MQKITETTNSVLKTPAPGNEFHVKILTSELEKIHQYIKETPPRPDEKVYEGLTSSTFVMQNNNEFIETQAAGT